MTISVVQGEREMVPDNKRLGNFNLEGIAPAPRGLPQIEVTFDIDANGIVSVSAKDKGTGKEQKITIQANGGLSDSEIEQMVKDAEANKESDKKKRELIDARNNADGMAHSTETQLKEHGDKISAEDKTAIENAIKDVQEATKTDDLQKIQDATTKLTTSAQKLGEAIYKQSQDQQPTQEANTTENKDDNVVDAEFEEVKK